MILKTFKKHPLLSLMQIFATFLMFFLFFWTVSFFMAVTPEEALKRGYQPIPSGWEAGVMSHGKYYEWYSIQNHPIFFFTCFLGFIILFSFTIISGYVVHIKGKFRRENETGSGILSDQNKKIDDIEQTCKDNTIR